MQLVCLYPFMQPDITIPEEMWTLLERSFVIDVLPVRQVAIWLLNRVNGLGLLEPSAAAQRLEVLSGKILQAIMLNHQGTHRYAGSADNQQQIHGGNWSFGVSEMVSYLSADSFRYAYSKPFTGVRSILGLSEMERVRLVDTKLIESMACKADTLVDYDWFVHLAADQANVGIRDDERQAKLYLLTEYVSAIYRQAVVGKSKDGQITVHKVIELIDRVLPQLSFTLAEPWQAVFRYVSNPVPDSKSFSAESYALVFPLIDYMLSELKKSFVHASQEDYARQAKWLMLLEVVIVNAAHVAQTSGSTDLLELARRMLSDMLGILQVHAVGHQYRMVRDRCGRMLFLLGTLAFQPASVFRNQLRVPLEELISRLASEAQRSPQIKDASDESRDVSASEIIFAWLGAWDESGDLDDISPLLHAFLPILFAAEGHANAEIAVRAKKLVDRVGGSGRFFTGSVGRGESPCEQVVDIVERSLESASWKARGAAIRFLSAFSFYHWPLLPKKDHERINTLACKLMLDSQREIQAMAKYLMRGLVHHQTSEEVAEMSSAWKKDSEKHRVRHGKFVRRAVILAKSATSTTDEQKLNESRIRQAELEMSKSVLGMCAIVLAFPYSVPPFVPPMFEELGKYLYLKHSSATIAYLEKTITETLLEFKRTHQDSWLETKSQFTSEQLAAIDDVSISPSYYS